MSPSAFGSLEPVLTSGSMSKELYITGDRRGGHLVVNQTDGKPYVPAKLRHPYAEGEVEFVTCAPGTK
jgi:hypothetical protein